MPFFCAECRTLFDGDEEFFYRTCPDCGKLAPTTARWAGHHVSKIPSSYFDTSLGVYIRGKKEKSRILNERGLVEIGEEPIPTPKREDKPILTDKEWHTAWSEITQSQAAENGDA